MKRYVLVNSNRSYRSRQENQMLRGNFVNAKYGPKEKIDTIKKGDVVFLYGNKVGIIAYGTADGKLIIKDYEGNKDEEHRMHVDRFKILGKPITPVEIIRMSKRHNSPGIFFARTVSHLDPGLGEALLDQCQAGLSSLEEEIEGKSRLVKIEYGDLNAKQKEDYNFMKLSGVLADYGFITNRLNSDWQEADLFAYHKDGKQMLKIQLKSRVYFAKKYVAKGIDIAFPEGEKWYLYPHDELLKKVAKMMTIQRTEEWKGKGIYHTKITERLRPLMSGYRIA